MPKDVEAVKAVVQDNSDNCMHDGGPEQELQGADGKIYTLRVLLNCNMKPGEEVEVVPERPDEQESLAKLAGNRNLCALCLGNYLRTCKSLPD